MSNLARQRWRMLGQVRKNKSSIYLFVFLFEWNLFFKILLSKNLDSSSDHDEISVMRFKTYGLYVRSRLTSENDDNQDDEDGTWCRIEFPSFEDHQSNLLSLDIRFVWRIKNSFDN